MYSKFKIGDLAKIKLCDAQSMRYIGRLLSIEDLFPGGVGIDKIVLPVVDINEELITVFFNCKLTYIHKNRLEHA